MKLPKLSNAVGPDPAAHTDSPETVNRTSFGDGFSSILNGLTQLAPTVADTVYTIKNGQRVPVQAEPQPMYMGEDSKKGIDNNILIYIGLGFLVIIASILIFKKVK